MKDVSDETRRDTDAPASNTSSGQMRHAPEENPVSRKRLLTVAPLLLFAAACFYIRFVQDQLGLRGLFEYVGVDYRVWWSATQVAVHYGVRSIYDLDKLRQSQSWLYYSFAVPFHPVRYMTMPMPYLPIFIAPLLPLTFFSPVSGFIYWTTYEAMLMILYLIRFQRRVDSKRLPEWWWIALSFPVFLDLQFGNVNVWMLILTGEVIISFLDQQETRTGFFLGLMMVKPQILVLIVPGLILCRAWRTLYSFSWTAGAIVIASIGVGGYDSLIELSNILSDYKPQYGNFPNSMMNLRMIGANLEDLFGVTAWPLVHMSMGACLLLGIIFFLRPEALSREKVPTTLMGALAATLAATWHSQPTMAVTMFPILYFLRTRGKLSLSVYFCWIVLPIVTFALSYYLFDLGPAHRAASASIMAFNLFFLFFALRRLYEEELSRLRSEITASILTNESSR